MLTDDRGLHPHIRSQALCQLDCQLGWGSSTPTYNVNKIQHEPKVQKARQKRNENISQALCQLNWVTSTLALH